MARDVKPGRKIQLAVFGINGPLSSPPTNFIWMRLARLEFYKESVRGPYPVEPQEVNVDVVRLDPAIDEIVPPNPKIFKLAEGFQFTEGPVWVRDGQLPALQRSQREPDLQVHRGGAALGLQGEERLRRRRHRRVRPAGLERPHPRSAGSPDDRRARQPARGPRGEDGCHDRARRPVRGQASQQPERPRLSVGRRALLHRSALRLAEVLRRPAQGAALQRRLLPREGQAPPRDQGADRARTGSRSRPTRSISTSGTGTRRRRS